MVLAAAVEGDGDDGVEAAEAVGLQQIASHALAEGVGQTDVAVVLDVVDGVAADVGGVEMEIGAGGVEGDAAQEALFGKVEGCAAESCQGQSRLACGAETLFAAEQRPFASGADAGKEEEGEVHLEKKRVRGGRGSCRRS